MTGRRCFDCGAVGADGATFPGPRKPARRRDRCDECLSYPLAVAAERIAARRAEIAALRAAGGYRAQKSIRTAPLFAWAASMGEV